MDEFLKFLKQAAGPPGVLDYASYIEHALYHERFGYYCQSGRKRVGHHAEADFYTSESLGDVFKGLVLEAASQLLQPMAPEDVEFVEIGAEPGESVAGAAKDAFGAARILKRGEILPTDRPLLVFCNELFDAQPFHRLVRAGGQWTEMGVAVGDDGLREVRLPEATTAVAHVLPDLPDNAPEGYRIDLPLAAEELMRVLTATAWSGVFIAIDYGLDWADITLRRPSGTARTYYRQQLGTDLLERPGQQDITCHICWDRLENELRESRFEQVKLERQEAFFIRHAGEEIRRIMEHGTLLQQGTLRELIHPMRMGASFQVLTGRRGL